MPELLSPVFVWACGLGAPPFTGKKACETGGEQSEAGGFRDGGSALDDAGGGIEVGHEAGVAGGEVERVDLERVVVEGVAGAVDAGDRSDAEVGGADGGRYPGNGVDFVEHGSDYNAGG